MSSVDELENLLEATDMQLVENSQADLTRYGDLWDRLRRGMKMDSRLNNSRIDGQRSWFSSRQTYLDRLTARASRYLYHTVTEAERRGLPTELALLPVIESSYDPGATSNAAAAGLWQFIPSTGRIYGLDQTSSYDGRRDVVESTRAAYDFLTSLYEKFGSWELALAAYNAGPGRIQQAINRNAARGLPTDYWSLSLPQETMNYVPRFMAVAQIVRNPSAFGVRFNGIANRPHFKAIPVQAGTDLARVASMAGLSFEEIYALNPAHRNGFVSPESSQLLLLPHDLPASVERQLRSLSPGGYWAGNQTTPASFNGARETSLMVQNTAPPPLAPLTNAQAAALMGTSAPGRPLTAAPASPLPGLRSEPPISRDERQDVQQGVLQASRSAVSPGTGNRTPGLITLPAASGSLAAPAAVASAGTGNVTATSVTTIDNVPRAASGEPLVSPEERREIVQEIRTINPAATSVIDPADGRVNLTAIPTQQTILERKGETRAVVYERPALARAAAPVVRPVAVQNRPQGRRTVYTVKPGDSLTAVARLYNVSLQQLAEWNQMEPTASLLTGNTLYLYGVSEPKPPARTSSYVVQSGDTLTALARRFDLSLQQLAAYNGLSPLDDIQIGVRLSLVPTGKSSPQPVARTTESRTPTRPASYVVQAGDSLTGLARRFDLPLQQLAAYNGLSPLDDIQTGVRLSLVPTGKTSPASASSARADDQSAARSNSGNTATSGYRVRAGETLTELAERAGMSLSDLARLNDVPVTERIQTGQTIRLPAARLALFNTRSRDAGKSTDKSGDRGSDSSANSSSNNSDTAGYRVRPGDTLLGIAVRHGLTLSEMARLNSRPANSDVRIGETLKVPAKTGARTP